LSNVIQLHAKNDAYELKIEAIVTKESTCTSECHTWRHRR